MSVFLDMRLEGKHCVLTNYRKRVERLFLLMCLALGNLESETHFLISQ